MNAKKVGYQRWIPAERTHRVECAECLMANVPAYLHKEFEPFGDDEEKTCQRCNGAIRGTVRV